MNPNTLTRALAKSLHLFFIAALLAWLTLVPVPTAYAATFTVTSTVDAVDAAPGNGVCATVGGVCTLRAAIQEANALAGADIITVPAGTYTLTIVGAGEDAAATGDLDITSNITLTGAGAGSTIIQAGTIGGFSGNGIDRVFHVTGAFTVAFQNLTIANGLISADAGGGILNNGTLTISNSTFSGNSAGGGGGIENGGTLTISNSTFSSNSGSAGGGRVGGGIRNTGTLTISNSTFSGNNTMQAGSGGGISNGGTLTISTSTFSGNSTADNAGGIGNAGTLTISNSTFSGNSSAEGSGGGISNGGTLTISNSTFSNNGVPFNGGGINNFGTLTISNSTFSGNDAGGGSGFGGFGGGGIHNSSGTLTISNSTFSGNNAGGIYTSGGTTTLSNTIVANSVTSGNCSGTIINGGNNLQFGGSTANSCGATITTANPLLGALTGSPAFFPLSAGSPAIDAGSNAICAAAPVSNTSQNGVTRPTDGDGNGTATCDIGSYEAPATPPPPLTITNGPPPNGTVGVAYSFAYTSTGSPTFSVTAGSLPPGLTLSAAGVISGTPTTAGAFTGTVRASNGTLPNATQAFSITTTAGTGTAPVPTFSATASGTTSNLTLNASLRIGDADVGRNGNVYLAAYTGSAWFVHNGSSWVSWSGGSLPVYSVGLLANQSIELVRNANLSTLVGTQIYVGYGLNENDMLTNGKYGLVYTVGAGTAVTGVLVGPVGAQVLLQNNAADNLAVTASHATPSANNYAQTVFTFVANLLDGAAYSVSVANAPADQTCMPFAGATGIMPVAARSIWIGCEFNFDHLVRSTDDAVVGGYSGSQSPMLGGANVAIGATANAYGEGRFAVFQSYIAGITGSSTGAYRQVFWRDRLTGETVLVSATAAGAEGNGDSDLPALSADGLTVAFESGASNLVAGDTNGVSDIFVWSTADRAAGVRRVSVGANGAQTNATSNKPSLSGDGKVVAFTSYATNLTAGGTGGGDVYRRDLTTGINTLVSKNASGVPQGGDHPVLSEDGNRLAFYSYWPLLASDTNDLWDIYVYQHSTASLKRVSLTSTGAERDQGSESSSRIVAPAISGNGQYVAYASTASNVVPGDTNGLQDVFVVHVDSGSVVRASVSSAGVQGNADSPVGQGEHPSLSADGKWVAFSTAATNLAGTTSVVLRNWETNETRATTAHAGWTGVGPVSMTRTGAYVAFWSGWPLDLKFDNTSGLFARFTGLQRAFTWVED